MGLVETYFGWLKDEVSGPFAGTRTYEVMLRNLFNWEFVPIWEFDDNRAKDGLALRDEFIDRTGLSAEGSPLIKAPCNMFELTLALAKRVAWELDGYTQNTLADWFWILLGNLGLDRYWDEFWGEQPHRCSKEFEHVVRRLVEREYDFDGTGGYFPLHHPRRDQRNIEIWSQMNDWCSEQIS